MMLSNISFVLIFFASLARVNCLICYNCGYMELPDGKKVPIEEDPFGKIPFCDDFTSNKENTMVAYPVRQ